jgi:hypothetical protein
MALFLERSFPRVINHTGTMAKCEQEKRQAKEKSDGAKEAALEE